MTRLNILFVLVLVVGIFTGQLAAQDGIFAGHGYRNSSDDAARLNSNNRTWSNMIDFSNDRQPEESRFSLFGQRPSMNGWKNPFKREGETGSTTGLFGNMNMPALFPKRDPNAPNFMQQINSRGKNAIDRTASWAQRQNDSFRTKTFDTWDTITKNLGGGRDRLPARRTEPNMPPPVRTAELPTDQTTVRY